MQKNRRKNDERMDNMQKRRMQNLVQWLIRSLCGFMAKTPNILQMQRGEGMSDEKCAICELDDYHDSEQYICDDCFRELEVLAAEQLASYWD